MLPETLLKAEVKLRETADDLAAALAHGNDAEKREAREAWRAALREKRQEAAAALTKERAARAKTARSRASAQ